MDSIEEELQITWIMWLLVTLFTGLSITSRAKRRKSSKQDAKLKMPCQWSFKFKQRCLGRCTRVVSARKIDDKSWLPIPEARAEAESEAEAEAEVEAEAEAEAETEAEAEAEAEACGLPCQRLE